LGKASTTAMIRAGEEIAATSRFRAVRILCLLPLVLMALSACAAPITVFAAISLRESLREIADQYEKATADKVVFSLGASSLLARQIEAGATPDIYVSADEGKMDALQAKGLILKESRRDLLRNALVIVVASEKGAPVKTPADLAEPEVKRVALADPRAVPAGIYGKEYLLKQGLWEKVEKKVVAAVDVRAALAAVVAGNADAGIVYRTDAATSRQVRVTFAVPEAEGPRITYPAARVAGGKNPEGGARFLTYLQGAEAQAVFREHGFVPVMNPEGAAR
jgi:molybdate transport system substrate-binding protein